MAKIRVLYLFDALNLGGAETSLVETISRYRSTEAVVCGLYPGEAMAQVLKDAGARVVGSPLVNRNSFLAAARFVEALVRRERPDILQTTLFRSGIAGRIAAPRLGIPVIDTFVNDSYAVARWRELRGLGKLKLGAVWLLDRLTANRPTLYLANSQSVAKANVRALRIAYDKVRVIYRGRDPLRYASASATQRSVVRTKLGISSDTLIILTVGRLLKRKGQENLLESVVGLKTALPNFVLLLVGEGPLRGVLESQVQRLGIEEQVRLLGARRDVPDLLQACDIFVFPSLFEGCPGALIEAMLAGKPIVATDIPPNREVLGGPDFGMLVRPQSPAEIAAAVCGLAGDVDRAAAIGRNARARALRMFDVAAIAREHEDLYEGILRHAVC